MPLLTLLLLFIFAPSVHAQECACPVVQCDPCQRRLVIDSQKIQCTAERSVVCENVVCENVDNYFQCLAGAPSHHVPAEDAISRMSIPQFKEPAVPMSTPIELPQFKHFAPVETTISSDEKPVKARLREPASPTKNVDLAPQSIIHKGQTHSYSVSAVEKVLPLQLHGLLSAKIDGKKIRPVKTQSIAAREGVVSSIHKGAGTLTYGKLSARFEMAANSEVRFSKEDDHLVVYPTRGTVHFKKITAPQMLIIDAGDWRLGKATGDVSWSLKNNEAIIDNSKGTALLRRDQLIAPSETIPEGMELVVSEDYGIVHADRDGQSFKKTYQLDEKIKSTKARRVLASTAIANEGCAQPHGEVQQCAWKCFGAKGKSCINSDTTQCVRFTCSMGGEWKLPTRVSGRECKASGVEVHACN